MLALHEVDLIEKETEGFKGFPATIDQHRERKTIASDKTMSGMVSYGVYHVDAPT